MDWQVEYENMNTIELEDIEGQLEGEKATAENTGSWGDYDEICEELNFVTELLDY